MMTKPLALCLAAVSTLAAVAAHATIDAGDLKLVEASGVPNEPERRYVFQGAIHFVSTPMQKGDFTAAYENFWAEGYGTWDEKKKEAHEGFKLSGSLEGKLSATFKCPNDPWLTKSGGCVLVSAPYKGTAGKNYDWNSILGKLGRPMSGLSVNAAVAQQFSMQHPNKPPGPQATVPPPKNKTEPVMLPVHAAQPPVTSAHATPQLTQTRAGERARGPSPGASAARAPTDMAASAARLNKAVK